MLEKENSIVRKLVRPNFKRNFTDYFALYRSKYMRNNLTQKAVQFVISQCKKDVRTSRVATQVGVSQRRIQQIYAEFRKTGKVPVLRKAGRKPSATSHKDTKQVLDEFKNMPAGVRQIARRLRKRYDISYYNTYRIMKENNLITPSPAKSRKRKWVRFERKYSNAMWHVDWHEMKDPRFRGFKLVTYLDDASRCVLACQVFKEATSENAVIVLQKAIKEFGTPATILSDNGACFIGARGRKKNPPSKSWTPTAFEDALLNYGIELINARPYHPQTNGKLERFHRSVEEEIGHHDSMSAFIEYYNTKRLHWSLDIDNYETPMMAFKKKKATKAIRKSNPNWMEEDSNE